MDKGVNEKTALCLTTAKVKKETFDEEIKEYAETAMNELLGWYGYGTPREDLKVPANCHSNSNSNSSGPDSPRFAEGCGWCGKPVEESTGLTAGTNTFCSELCFSQSRRANFKKNKTCDWCRHVRHTVSYVDFQDGASQLQFCSDKCLNQYKMHIFCRETRAHLEMHPHLPIDDSGTGLITPELWMKNCKSPESRTPTPPDSPKLQQQPDLPQTSPLPLITVAHPSKLMASNCDSHDGNRRIRSKTQRRQRKRCSSTVTCPNYVKPQPELPQDLRVRHSPVNCIENHQLRDNINPSLERIPNPYFCQQQPPFPSDPRTVHPGFVNPLTQPPPPIKPAPANVLPPVTVLVPYPILVPVPLPIPIPLPLKSFLQADQARKSADVKNVSSNGTVDPPSNPMNHQNGNSSQDSGDSSLIEVDDVSEEKEVVKNGVVRPLRKRKRAVDPKSRVLLKKKPVST
ncbi:putative sine oculis-binding protein [Trypoxylus dichotomus]